jgi:hypothetical protein
VVTDHWQVEAHLVGEEAVGAVPVRSLLKVPVSRTRRIGSSVLHYTVSLGAWRLLKA